MTDERHVTDDRPQLGYGRPDDEVRRKRLRRTLIGLVLLLAAGAVVAACAGLWQLSMGMR